MVLITAPLKETTFFWWFEFIPRVPTGFAADSGSPSRTSNTFYNNKRLHTPTQKAIFLDMVLSFSNSYLVYSNMHFLETYLKIPGDLQQW